MRIKHKPTPRLGDTRIIKKFLWFPLWLNDSEIWLEKVKIKEEYRRVKRPTPTQYGIIYRNEWIKIEFIDI